MLADFSAKGCLKYKLLWCAGSIAMNPILVDFEDIFHVSIATWWIWPCDLLYWWYASLYVGRLQCKWVAKISITLVCRVHSNKPHVM